MCRPRRVAVHAARRADAGCRRVVPTSILVIHDDSPPGSADAPTTVDEGSMPATISAIASAGMTSMAPVWRILETTDGESSRPRRRPAQQLVLELTKRRDVGHQARRCLVAHGTRRAETVRMSSPRREPSRRSRTPFSRPRSTSRALTWWFAGGRGFVCRTFPPASRPAKPQVSGVVTSAVVHRTDHLTTSQNPW